MNQFQSFADVVSTIKRRFVLIVALSVLGAFASVYFALTQEKMFEAIAVVQVERGDFADSVASQAAARNDTALRVRLMEQRLMSRDNLEAVITKYDLYSNEPEFTLNDKVNTLRESVSVEQILSENQAWQPNPIPSGLSIYAKHSNPEMAALLANEFLDTVITFSRERSASRADNTLAFFTEEEASKKADVDALSEQLAAVKADNAEYLPASQTELRRQLTDLRSAELKIEQDILTLQSNSARQRQELVRQQVGVLEDQKALLATRISTIEAKLLAAPAIEKEIAALERDLKAAQDQYAALTRSRADAEMGRVLEDRQQVDRFEELERAVVPEDPITRSRKKVAIMGGVVSVAFAIGVAFALDMLNPAIRTAAQMERALGLRPVVEIPTIHNARDSRLKLLTRIIGFIAVAAGLAFVVRTFQDKFGTGQLLPWVAADQN
jgi:uncharacterized protein involved in exopolysaccharide biosynthesis